MDPATKPPFTSDRPKVSVVTPCYNAAAFLTRAVNSIRHQTLHDWEMILVDDHSADNTLHVAEQLAKEDSRIRLVKHHENKGPSAARNTGIAQAKAEYVTLLDADDTFAPTYLEKAVKTLDSEPKVCLVQTNFSWDGAPNTMLDMPENMTLEEHLSDMLLMICHTFRKKCWKEVGGFDERMRYAEDWHYLLKLHAQNLLHYVVLKEPLYRYYRDNKTSLTKITTIDAIRKSQQIIYNDFSELYDQHMTWIFRKLVKDWMGNIRARPKYVMNHPIWLAARKKITYRVFLWGAFLIKCPVYLMYLWTRKGKIASTLVLQTIKQKLKA